MGHTITAADTSETDQLATHPRVMGWLGTTAIAMGGSNQMLFLVSTIYQGELATGTRTVTITAGATTAANITDNFYTPSAANTIFRIGTWDGTPLGFLNSNLITYMHPTDVRMSPWAADSTGVTNFIVGTNPDSSFPMAEWHSQDTAAPYIDTDNRMTFTLTPAQAATAMTFRIGLTRLDSARPNITVNSTWSSAIQGIATEPTARGLTTGNWRGNNVTYSFNIPTANLHAGTNTIDIYSVSGSTGTLYSGYHIYDALDLVTTASITNAPVVTTLAITPSNPTFAVNTTQSFTAQAYDQFGNPMPSNVNWSTTIGTIDNTGTFIAPSTASSGTVTATFGTVTATSNVTAIVGSPPTVATAASASPNPVVGTTTSLSVLGADNGGESNLTYTWTASGPAAVSFSANGTNAAKSSVATFAQAGTYTFTVTIKDPQNLFVTSTVTVIVNQTYTSIAPAGANMAAGTFQQITPLDQFGQAISIAGFTWTATAGTIFAAGVYSAPASGSTSTTITGTSGGTAKSTTVTIISPLAWYQADQTAGPNLNDSSGNSNTAALTTPYSFGTGAIGSALHLTGGYASLPTGIISNTTDFTIAAWINPDSLSNWMRIFDFGTGQTKYMFLTPDAGTSNALRFSITTSGGTGEQQLNGPAITAGVWTHVAVTLIGNTGTLYVNGVAVATNTAMTLHPSSLGSTGNNYLGKSQFSDPAYQGSIDDFRIYNSGLSAGAIASLYSTTIHTPSVATVAAASPSPVTGTTTALSVLGSEQAGESNLAYTWSATGPAAVTYSINGTNAAKSSTATFTLAGTYNFTVTIADPAGSATASSVSVIVSQTPATLSVTPASGTALIIGATQQYAVRGTDQFGQPIASPAVTWTATGGVVSASGLFTAGQTAGAFSVTATAGSATSTATGTVSLPVWLGSGSIATWTPATHMLIVTGVASIIADPGTDEPIIEASGTPAVVTLNPSSGIDIHIGGLSLTGGAIADVTSLGSARSTTNYRLLLIGTAGASVAPLYTIDATSKLDLADNDMTIFYGTGASPFATVQGELQQAFDGGVWDKPGLTSSVAALHSSACGLGYATSAEYTAGNSGSTTFDGQQIFSGAVLVKYTLLGDATLAGSVGLSDYLTVEANLGASNTDWSQGNFHYGIGSNGTGLGDLLVTQSNLGASAMLSILSSSAGSASAAPALNTGISTPAPSKPVSSPTRRQVSRSSVKHAKNQVKSGVKF